MSNLGNLILHFNSTKSEDSVMEIRLYDGNNTQGDGFIVVYPGNGTHKEGKIPHMHINMWELKSMRGINKKRYAGKQACLTLDKAAYFDHSNSTNYQLREHEKEFINEFLKRVNIIADPSGGLTNWQVLCKFWNENNPNTFEVPVEQPDYSGYLMSFKEYKESRK